MFDLTPLSRPVAVIEILLLLALAAFIGWLLARLILNNRIQALRSAIADQESELDDCRRSKIVTPVTKDKSVSYVDTEVTRPAYVAVTPVTDTINPVASLPTEQPTTSPASVSMVPNVTPTPSPTMAGGSETAVLQRIAARASELNFDRIGVATAAEADDLKDIVGIGPFLERKLHSLGIFTFRQISHFEKEDIDKINEIIEFFPGRIQRDNWVEQSRVFYERKYGKPEASQS